MLRAVDVSFAYERRTVLCGVTLAVAPGELVGILGPNGSGKTTMLRVLAGMLRPATGHVEIDGIDLRAAPRAWLARRMAIVPQETHLAFEYSVSEIALMGRYPHLRPFEIEGPDDIRIARSALAETGTAALEHRSFMTLSGGEKQRVIIASALAQFGPRSPRRTGDADPTELLLLDEPTASLDLGYQLDVTATLKRLNAERCIAMVISTHDLNFAASLCRRLVLLRDGQVLAAGPTDGVLTADAIRRLYDVEAAVEHHATADRLTVVPLGRYRPAARP